MSDLMSRKEELRRKLYYLADDSIWTSHRGPLTVHVVGGGTMGRGIAVSCADAGCYVAISDCDEPRTKQAVEHVRSKTNNPHLVIEHWRKAHQGIDVFIEAVPEDVNLKRKVFEYYVPLMSSTTLIATNTSCIPLQELQQGLKRELVGLHFFNPVSKMPLVEVVTTKQTSKYTYDRAMSFVRYLSKLPVPVDSQPGFVVNRILLKYLASSVTLLNEGYHPARIDKVATDFGMPIGPIELIDMIGIDVVLSIYKSLNTDLDDVQITLQHYVSKGRLGNKIGLGIYDRNVYLGYIPPRWQIPHDMDVLTHRGKDMMHSMSVEAQKCLDDNVVCDPDFIDAAVVFGTGYPADKGGPLAYADRLKCNSVMNKIFACIIGGVLIMEVLYFAINPIGG